MVTPKAGRPTPPSDATVYLLSLAKNFSIQAIGIARIFDWKGGGGGEPQITRNDVVRNLQKRNFL